SLYNTDFDKLTLQQSKLLLVNLLDMIITLNKNYYTLADLKCDNIGYNSSFNCILIDYDNLSMYQYVDDEQVSNQKTYNQDVHIGTYFPVFVQIPYLLNGSDICKYKYFLKSKHDKY